MSLLASVTTAALRLFAAVLRAVPAKVWKVLAVVVAAAFAIDWATATIGLLPSVAAIAAVSTLIAVARRRRARPGPAAPHADTQPVSATLTLLTSMAARHVPPSEMADKLALAATAGWRRHTTVLRSAVDQLASDTDSSAELTWAQEVQTATARQAGGRARTSRPSAVIVAAVITAGLFTIDPTNTLDLWAPAAATVAATVAAAADRWRASRSQHWLPARSDARATVAGPQVTLLMAAVAEHAPPAAMAAMLVDATDHGWNRQTAELRAVVQRLAATSLPHLQWAQAITTAESCDHGVNHPDWLSGRPEPALRHKETP